jgi:mono/diheme cytochrome c family protein
MKKTAITMILALLVLMIAPAMFAADGSALFKAKCQACHGPDGTKMAKANLSAAEVQGKTDADLVTFVGTNAKHNFKAKGLSDDDIKAIVTFLRTLKK